MESDEGTLVTSEASGESKTEVHKTLEELLAETSRAIRSDAQLCFFRIQFNRDDEYRQLNRRKRILSEIGDALEIWGTKPKLEEITSSDFVIELVVETRISPETIVDALNHDCIDTVAYWKIDPDKFDLDVANTDDVTALRDQLDQEQSANSVAVRLDHVQSQMDTFAAYIDSLEEFLDEEGTAQQLLENLRADMDDLREELQSGADERDELHTRVTELETTTPSSNEVDAEIARIDCALENLANEFRRETDELHARLDTIQADLDDQIEWRQRLCTAVASTEFNHDVEIND
ncbi:hypothetical protein SAMN05192552_104010 [Natrinema hispanicum]|uniref:Uncharacterized protein n=1 Tax=Natrinema hispanicum TaxID=392421 RepID=A0A1G6WTK0_9EURY|nr:hypothetical protein SAMN05192552_104010 [Natrinema hispanicum]